LTAQFPRERLGALFKLSKGKASNDLVRLPGKIRFSTSSKLLLLLAIAMLCCVMPISAQIFLSFDAPGAGTGLYQRTFANCINENGAITGAYVDGAGLQHGYVRSGSAGHITGLARTPTKRCTDS
jgi:hypothetical protein